MAPVDIEFADARRLGYLGEVTELSYGYSGESIELPQSFGPRGLALRSLSVSSRWDGLWRWLGLRRNLYFISVAVDMSGRPPQVMPAASLGVDAIHHVKAGNQLTFTLGEGAPVFMPQTIHGALALYLVVCDADKGVRHVGEVMRKIHADLTANNSTVMQRILALISHPSKTMADELLSAGSAILLPIATVLSSNEDDHRGAARGVFKANSSWAGQLSQSWDGGSIELAEI